MIDWNKVANLTEPPFTMNWSHDDITNYMTSTEITEDIKVPCHTQATERNVKEVTRASMLVTEPSREGLIATSISARLDRPRNESKQDYQN